MRLGRPKSRLVLKKNRPPGHAHAQWDIALFSVRARLADALDALDLDAEVIPA
jgi:hypothetical protein